MKHNFQPISNDEYLSLVNSEADPGKPNLDIKYYKIGKAYFVYTNTEFGKFMSDLVWDSLPLEEIEQKIDDFVASATATYENRKKGAFTPNFMSFHK